MHPQGELLGCPEKFWINQDGVANIVSLFHMKKHFRVTYDSGVDDAFYLHKNDRETLRFAPNGQGLYYLDLSNTQGSCSTFSLVTTVQDQQSQYTNRGIQQAQLAQRAQNIMMRPPTRKFIDIVSKNLIRNCPIDSKHIQAADDIFGPNIGALKGKTTRQKTGHVTGTIDPVPPDILHRHKDVTLALDIMFVNMIPFFVTISRDIRYATVGVLENRQMPTVRALLKQTIAQYERRGFHIRAILADEEFEPLEREFPDKTWNICGANEHVPEIERFIRTIKDSMRAQYNDLPFRYIPRVLITRMAGNAAFWWNAFPPKDRKSVV